MKHTHLAILGILLASIVIGLSYCTQYYKSSASNLSQEVNTLEKRNIVLTSELDTAVTLNTKLQNKLDLMTTNDSANRKFYELTDGSERFGSSFDIYTFKTADHIGTVEHICENPEAIIEKNSNKYCQADSFFLLNVDEKMSIIDSFTYTEQGDEIGLSIPTFNEGTELIATSTDRSSGKLLVSTNPHYCLWEDGMCFSPNTLSYIIDIPDGNIIKVQFQTELYSQARLHWNEAGTKAFYPISCPAGCPTYLLYALDINKNRGEALIDREDFGDIFYKTATWIDNDTIEVINDSGESTELSF